MDTVKIYRWDDIRKPIIEMMEEWLRKPSHRKYVHLGIPKFPDGKSIEYLYSYIKWVSLNVSDFDTIIPDTCFIVEVKETRLLFDYVKCVYAESFPPTIP